MDGRPKRNRVTITETEIWSAVLDAVRYERPPNSKTAGEIAQETQITVAAAEKRLMRLGQAGKLESRLCTVDGKRQRFYWPV